MRIITTKILLPHNSNMNFVVYTFCFSLIPVRFAFPVCFNKEYVCTWYPGLLSVFFPFGFFTLFFN